MIRCLFHIIYAVAHLRVTFLHQKPNCRSIKAEYTGLAITRLPQLCQLVQILEPFYNDANYPRPMPSGSDCLNCWRVRCSMADLCQYQPAVSGQVLVTNNGVQATRARTETLNPLLVPHVYNWVLVLADAAAADDDDDEAGCKAPRQPSHMSVLLRHQHHRVFFHPHLHA